MKPGKRWLRWLAFLVGLGVFAVYLRQTDLRAVGSALKGLGVLGGLLLIPYFVVYLVDAWAWRLSFGRPTGVGYLRMFFIRWSGESVNNLVPTAYVGGEAIKVMLLKREGVPAAESTAAALISKTAQTLGQVLFLVAGAGAYLALRREGDPRGMVWGLAAVLAGGATVVSVLLWLQRRGVASTLIRLLSRLGIRSRRLAALRPGWEAMDAIVARFFRARRLRFVGCACAYLLGWLLDTVEVYLAGRLLGLPVTWTQALVLESFTGVVKVVGLWVPGALGVQESGIVLLGRWVGAPALFGPTYALLRRARELVYAAIGFGMLALWGVGDGRGAGDRSESG
ncbi:MAG: lysylphosphatidylglycerol synthase domain-containing protein [Limisphaerales bacterium]